MNAPTHYETLGVSPAASLEDIKKQYRSLARRYHPDVARTADATERFRLINEAYRVLSDTGRRALYDSELKLAAMKRRSQTPPSGPPPQPNAPSHGTRRADPPRSARTAPGSAPSAEASPQRSPAEVLMAQAHVAFRRMRYREAEALCRQALRFDRRIPVAYEILGDVLRARGRPDEALAMYSYALQLDHGNRGVQAKLDRIVGRPSGPTMSGRAARAARRAAPKHREPRIRLSIRPKIALVSGIGLATIAYLLVVRFMDANPPATSGWIFQWNPQLVSALAAAGAISGFVLAVSGALARCREELAAPRTAGGRRGAIPLGAVLLGFDLLFFYAAFLVYLLIGFLKESGSPSTLTAFAASFGVVVLFALVSHASAPYVLTFGGNVVFLAFVGGWSVGDIFRTAS